MGKLPSEIKLTLHARQRLEERKNSNNFYNTKNLMRSSCKWYGKDDLIPQSALYLHCLYVCRKAKNKMGYITDGNIEVLYDKGARVAITILEVKEKFLPITQYIKPNVLKEIERKKELKKLNNTSKLEDTLIINKEPVINYNVKSTDNDDKETITFHEGYASVITRFIKELLKNKSNLKKHSIETEQPKKNNRNIVYREKTISSKYK